jgi:hypothetical protein
MAGTTATKRYGFAAGRKPGDPRLYPALLLGLSVALFFFLYPTTAWSLLIIAPLTLLGLYRLIRSPGDAWYVELGSDELSIHFFGSTTIPYSDIESVEQLFPSGFWRLLEMGAVKWGNLFGGAAYQDVDCRVKLSFRRRIRGGLIPPFRRKWVIPMEDPEEFAADVNARIAFAARSR